MSTPVRLDAPLIRLGAVLITGGIAALLDTTIVAVAIDGLAREYGASASAVQWVTTSYLLAMAAVTPLTGWSADRFGAKRMWTVSIAAFAAGSVLSGLAWSIGSLVAFRVVQGLGGGMILPLLQTILARAAGPERFGRVMAMVAIPGQLAPIAGPVIGGAIVAGPGWRWIFLVNVPIVAVALLLARRGVPADDTRDTRPPDWRGMALLSPGLVLVLHGLSSMDPRWAVGGAVLVAGYVLRALRIAHPLIDLRLFAARSFTATSGLVFLAGVGTWGPLFLLPLFYQRLRGADPLETGLLLAPQGMGVILAIIIAGRLADDARRTRLLILGGTLVTAAATIPFALTVGDGLVLTLALFVRGIGLGLSSVPLMAAMYRSVPREAIPSATSVSGVVQRVGAAVGTTLLAVILDAGSFAGAFTWTIALALAGVIPALLIPRSNR